MPLANKQRNILRLRRSLLTVHQNRSTFRSPAAFTNSNQDAFLFVFQTPSPRLYIATFLQNCTRLPVTPSWTRVTSASSVPWAGIFSLVRTAPEHNYNKRSLFFCLQIVRFWGTASSTLRNVQTWFPWGTWFPRWFSSRQVRWRCEGIVFSFRLFIPLAWSLGFVGPSLKRCRSIVKMLMLCFRVDIDIHVNKPRCRSP